MNLTRSQLIIIGSALLIILFIIGVATGIIPGLRSNRERPPELTLTIWGIDSRVLFNDNILGYTALRPNVRVNYEEINPATYEQDLINALAAGRGPDVVMFHNSWLPKHYNKIVPVKSEQLLLSSLQQQFPEVIEQDFAPDGQIFALPLYIDTLALLYNRDTFDRTGIALPPKDWLEFQSLIPKLIQKNEVGNITRPAAAIGGSGASIDKASDFLMLLMLQAGARMTNEDFTQATFAQNIGEFLPGVDALNFYTKFSDPRDEFYTWNDSQEYSLDNFARGNTAIIFNYAYQQENIRDKNPFLNFRPAEMPQPSGSVRAVNFPDYWGLAVTNNSKNPDWAWDLILYFTANETAAENYLTVSNRPPALRTLIQKYANHPDLGVFARQALSARSWPRIDKVLVDNLFSDMIRATITGQLDLSAAVVQAERQITELMRARR